MEEEIIDNPEQPAGEPAEITEEVEGAEPSPEVTADPAEDLVKKENKTQKRIDQITKEKHEARAEAEYWRKVATGEIKPAKQWAAERAAEGIQAPAIPQNSKPQVDQFDTYEDFVEALTDWKVETREADKQAAAEQRKMQEKRQTVEEANASRIEAAKTVYDDYDEVTGNLNGIMVPAVTIEAMQESELSAELFYYLGQNIEEAKKLQTLSVPAQLREIGKIEAKLEKKPLEVKRVSQAPTPIKPTGGNGEVVPKKSEADMSDDEWLAHERKRLAALGRKY